MRLNQNELHLGQLRMGNSPIISSIFPISPRWFIVTQTNTMLAISNNILSRCYVNTRCDSNLISAWLRLLTAFATAVAHIHSDRFGRSCNRTDGECWRCSRRTRQTDLTAYVLSLRRARVTRTIGHCARNLTLLTIGIIAK